MACADTRNLSHPVPAGPGCGVSWFLCPPCPLPTIQGEEQLREPAVSRCGGGLGAWGCAFAEARRTQARGIAPESQTSGPGDALARCRGALPCQFLRAG